mmetsp:Transcript_19928/g.59731  ORF Transcript_19928/g.59731 Transcript_19928/m.59731 type:complete len:259 (-) Transcript_19928:27-803(-)
MRGQVDSSKHRQNEIEGPCTAQSRSVTRSAPRGVAPARRQGPRLRGGHPFEAGLWESEPASLLLRVDRGAEPARVGLREHGEVGVPDRAAPPVVVPALQARHARQGRVAVVPPADDAGAGQRSAVERQLRLAAGLSAAWIRELLQDVVHLVANGLHGGVDGGIGAGLAPELGRGGASRVERHAPGCLQAPRCGLRHSRAIQRAARDLLRDLAALDGLQRGGPILPDVQVPDLPLEGFLLHSVVSHLGQSHFDAWPPRA